MLRFFKFPKLNYSATLTISASGGVCHRKIPLFTLKSITDLTFFFEENSIFFLSITVNKHDEEETVDDFT